MDITWKYVKPLKDTLSVKKYLDKYHILLPEDVVSVIEKYNGGRPSNKQILTSSGQEYVFNSLLSYNKDDKETIYKVYPELFGESSLFPIGSDAAGNFICYDTIEAKYVLFNHESNEVENIKKMPFI